MGAWTLLLAMFRMSSWGTFRRLTIPQLPLPLGMISSLKALLVFALFPVKIPQPYNLNLIKQEGNYQSFNSIASSEQ